MLYSAKVKLLLAVTFDIKRNIWSTIIRLNILSQAVKPSILYLLFLTQVSYSIFFGTIILNYPYGEWKANQYGKRARRHQALKYLALPHTRNNAQIYL